MYYDEESGATNFVAGMLVGAILGAGIALLTAPASGRNTRARLVRRRASSDDGGLDEQERNDILRDMKRRRRKARR